MKPLNHRTKIVATIGPASNSREVIKQLIKAGMSVARLNFSHGSYEDHAKTISLLRSVSKELDMAVTILQDLQGPKIRVGNLPGGTIELQEGKVVTVIPISDFTNQENTIAIDYPFLAEEAQPEAQILLDDGLLELKIEKIVGEAVHCRVIEGGILKSRKGVNLPSLNLRLPSLTDKDKQDLEFGISQGIDWLSLSFVRKAEDIQTLKEILAAKGVDIPVIAKIEKPQAVDNLTEIINECDGLMVARGDLGVEMKPEKVPMLQKRIIKMCNQKGIPVITATQMLESMMYNPNPTRAEANDVANAIIDGTDAVMLSGESAVGKYPVKAVKMMVRIAKEVERNAQFTNHPPAENDTTHALSEALNTIDQVLDLRCIAAFTTTGYTARLAAAERPKSLVVAFTPHENVYHRLNLFWGVKPLLVEEKVSVIEDFIQLAEGILVERNLAKEGDTLLILGGSPVQKARGTNFLKIHSVADTNS